LDPAADQAGAGGTGKFHRELVGRLITHAEHEFTLSRPDKDGTTRRDHLQAVAAQGRPVEGLEAPPLPAELAYLFEWFLEASAARGSSGFGGIQPLSYAELAAWAQLTGVDPTPFEVSVIRLLDSTLVRVLNDGGHRGSHPD
jgi:hypothetical protein